MSTSPEEERTILAPCVVRTYGSTCSYNCGHLQLFDENPIRARCRLFDKPLSTSRRDSFTPTVSVHRCAACVFAPSPTEPKS